MKLIVAQYESLFQVKCQEKTEKIFTPRGNWWAVTKFKFLQKKARKKSNKPFLYPLFPIQVATTIPALGEMHDL